MAGNVRFELSSASPDDSGFSGSYPNGQRGSYPNASLDRSGSFRESGESRMISSGASTPRGSSASAGDLPAITQYLTLDPIAIENHKYTRLGELRRALGIISFGSTAEDNSFGAAHSKPAPAVGIEELKRFKASVQDASNKAKVRRKIFDESLQKLNQYCEVFNSKKQQRNEIITNERSGGFNLLKIGTQSSRNPTELVNQKMEERTKNVVMNKRVRSSVAEIRAEGQTNNLARRPLVIGKDRDMLRDCDEGSDVVDEKIRRLPAAGETWDRKMKRKRSVGPLLSRPLDDGEPKRAMHHKLNNDPASTSCDAQTLRSGPLNSTSKFDGSSLPGSSNGRAISKNELDKVSLSRDSMAGLSKERFKGNNKLNGREDSQIPSSNPLIKGKASRAPRSGPVVAGNLSANFPRTSGSLEGWEQTANVNKIHSVSGANNRNRPMPTGSSSPPMAKWVGQRPQKISRNRRANLVFPVSNHDDVQISPEGCSPSDFGTRLTFSASNGSLGRGMSNGAQQFKVKHENISSPTRLSESEDSGACENRESRLREKGIGSSEVEDKGADAFQNTVPSTLLTKKTKITIKEESGDSVRRQGRSGRSSSFPKVNISPVKEKLENLASAKPLKSTRLGSERSGSKSGRPPLKKISERKGIAGLGHISATGSPDFTGEPDDDHEELLAAASFACNASNLACSSPFWKKMQPLFAPVNLEEISNLKEQLNFMEVNYDSLSQMFGLGNDALNNFFLEENFESQAHASGKGRSLQDQVLDLDTVGKLNSERRKNVPPLYQRVLSALIMDDETEEFEEDRGGRVTCFQHSVGQFSSDTDFKQSNMVGFEFEGESIFDPRTLRQCAVDRFSCNGRGNITKGTHIHKELFSNNSLNGDQGVPRLDNGSFTESFEDGVGGTLSIHPNATGISSIDYPYEQMSMEDKLLLELQSVGLYPEIVPDLADGDDEPINSDILGQQRRLFEQVGKTKLQLKTIIEAIEGGNEVEKRGIEQLAMERLAELSYKKLLATRGSFASKHGVAKVPKQVAVGFMKRTLARCQRFEDTGKSCFSEPALRDAIYAVPPRESDPELTSRLGSAMKLAPETQNLQLECRLSGPLSDWGEQYDLYNDKFGKNSSNAFGCLTRSSEQDFAKTGPIMNRGKKKEVLLDDVGGSPSLKAPSNFGHNLLGGAKGKRSERERDKDTSARNSTLKAGRPLGNYKGERKTKPKPKQKTAQLSTSGNGLINSMHRSSTGFDESVGNGSNRKREVGLMSHGNNPDDQCTEIREPMDFTNLPLPDLDSIELGVNDLGGHQDLSTWLNIEEDGLQDNDVMGLDIPMDDLADLNMLL
ncbi:spectrin beta chain, brain [Parasponia andersonii]|uniref:Spectrin beta chain, brain n=1 Tax=Parasponia andersonii TaxID=3476 RepID=A0A2P5A964_PARAD|nr:spectrin beta chain, brain [Parasponia andersonii]